MTSDHSEEEIEKKIIELSKQSAKEDEIYRRMIEDAILESTEKCKEKVAELTVQNSLKTPTGLIAPVQTILQQAIEVDITKLSEEEQFELAVQNSLKTSSSPIASARKIPQGYEEVDVPHDGNCFYHALRIGLISLGVISTDVTVADLKKLIGYNEVNGQYAENEDVRAAVSKFRSIQIEFHEECSGSTTTYYWTSNGIVEVANDIIIGPNIRPSIEQLGNIVRMSYFRRIHFKALRKIAP